MIFESAGDLPTSVEAKGEAGFFFPAPPSLFFAGNGNVMVMELKNSSRLVFPNTIPWWKDIRWKDIWSLRVRLGTFNTTPWQNDGEGKEL